MISNDGNDSTEIPVGFLSRADCYKHGSFYRSVLDNVPIMGRRLCCRLNGRHGEMDLSEGSSTNSLFTERHSYVSDAVTIDSLSNGVEKT